MFLALLSPGQSDVVCQYVVFAVVTVFMAIASHASLSSNIGMGPPATSPKLIRSCLRNTTSWVDVDRAMYSDSVVERATKGWSLLA